MGEKDSIRSLNKKSFKKLDKSKIEPDIPFKKLKEQNETQVEKSSFLKEKIGRKTIKEEIDDF